MIEIYYSLASEKRMRRNLMTTTFIIMGIVLFILVSGIVFMAIGGRLNKKYSNRLMILRVGVQLLAVISALVIYYLAKQIS